MNYTVRYKKPNQWFFRKIKKVKGDGIIEGSAARYFILEDDSRIEMPCSCHFVFPVERFSMIKNRMENEARTPIVVNDGEKTR